MNTLNSEYGDHLSLKHSALLRSSAITPHVAAARGYRTVTQHLELLELGFRPYQALTPALLVPVHDVNGVVGLHQIRPDNPRVTDKGKEIKYETPKGTQLCVDVPSSIREQLGDPKVTLWITEGARKVDAAVSAGLCCVGLLGVNSWRGKNELGGKTALACWDSIALNFREVVICFDSDVMTKKAVSMACMALKMFLKKRGARVRLAYLPDGDDDEKVGLDDFFAAGGSVDDLKTCIEERSKPKGPDEKPPSKLDKEVNELVETVSVLFHTPAAELFAVITPNDTMQTVSVRSTALRNYLASSFYKQKKRAPSRESLAQARYVLEGKAMFEGPETEVYTRIATGSDGAIYIDLGDPKWRAIRVDAAGWNLVSRCPVRFRRAAGMLALPVPERGGSIDDLRPFVNVRGVDDHDQDRAGHDDHDDDFVLLVGWIIAAFRPRGPYPALILQGEQGSAKSTGARVCRRLIDPNKAELRSQPREPRDLAISANNAWVIGFDNISKVPNWLSDGLCCLATGGGFATRALFTDSEETIFDAQRPVLLNGIDSVATRGDLLDRSILLTFPRLKMHREENELWRDFEQVRSKILGALLDAVSTALRLEHETKLTTSVRMADAARWVQAAEVALPWEAGRFVQAYSENRADVNILALETSPVASELRSLVSEIGTLEGTAGEILEKLELRAKDSTKKLKSWPKTPRGLSGVLRRIAPNLRGLGFEVEFPGRESNRRPIVITSPEIPDQKNSAGVEKVPSQPSYRHADKEKRGEINTYESVPDDGCYDGRMTVGRRHHPDRHSVGAQNPNGNNEDDGHDGCDGTFPPFVEFNDLDEPELF